MQWAGGESVYGMLTMRTPLATLSNLREGLKRALYPHAHVWTFLIGVTLCGFVFGGIASAELNHANSKVLALEVQSLVNAIVHHQLANPWDLWWQRMVQDLQLLGVIWLFGVSVIGFPLVVVSLFLRAFSIGFTVVFTVMHYGLNGLAVAGFGVLLHQLMAMTILVFAGGLAIRFSASLLEQRQPISRLVRRFAVYMSWFAAAAAGLAVTAGIQSYLAPVLLAALLGHHS